MSGTETPADLGLEASALWEFFSPRHVVVSFDEPRRTSEAVLLYTYEAGSLLFMPGSTLPGGTPTVSVPADGEDGQEAALQVLGGYRHLPAGAHETLIGPEVTTATFSELGFSPALGAVLLAMPIQMLPEELAGIILQPDLSAPPPPLHRLTRGG